MPGSGPGGRWFKSIRLCVGSLIKSCYCNQLIFPLWTFSSNLRTFENKTSVTRSTARRCASWNHTVKIWVVRSMMRSKLLWTAGVAVCAHGSHEKFFVRFHADQDGLISSSSSGFASNLCRRPRGLKRVDEEHVKLIVKYVARGCVGWPVLTDDDKIGALAEQPNQRFTQETILHHQKYADRGAGDNFAHGIHSLLGCWVFRPRATTRSPKGK